MAVEDLYNNIFETEFSFDDMMGVEDKTVVLRTNEANNELGGIIAPIVKADANQTTQELQSGNETNLVIAEDAVRSAALENAYQIAEQELMDAQSAEESLEIMQRTQIRLDKPMNIATLREYFITQKLNPQIRELNSISSRIERDLVLAGEADKAINKVWESTGFLGVLGDFGELVIPVSGVIEEEYIKYENSIDSILDQVSKASPEEQAAVLQSAIDAWAESETLLLGNNNSLLTVDRMESIREAILDGGLSMIDGSMSRQQAEDAVFSALSGTILAGELKAIGTGLKGLLKFTMNRIFPSKPRFTQQGTDVTKRFVEGEFIPADIEGTAVDMGNFRLNSRTIDAEYSVKPDNFTVEKQNGLKDLTLSAGLKEEDAIDRMSPSPSLTTQVSFGNAFDEVTEVNDIALMDIDASTAGMNRGRILERQSGNSLKVVDSGVTLLRNEDSNSLGDFVITLGDSNKKGFTSQAEAELAARYSLAGTDYKTVQSNGQWFNTVTIKHEFDPRVDVADLYSGMRSRFNSNVFNFLDPLRVLGDDVLEGVFALKGVNRSKVTDKINTFNKAVRSFSHTKSEQLSKALKYGDDNGVEFATKQEFADSLGLNPSKVSDNTFEAYQTIRGIMDDIYAVRNDNFRKLKQSQGYKFLDTQGDGHLARPLAPNEIPNDVMNIDTRMVMKSDELGDKLIVRLDSPVQAADGTLWRTVAVLPEELKGLPTQLLRKREGHLDRTYRETGWTVKVRSSEIVDGVAQDVANTTHIVKSRKQAEDIRNSMLLENEDIDPTTVELVRSRENDELDKIYGDSNSVQFSYGGTHTRKRGEQLKGSDGLNAPILDPLESITKSMHSLQREYDVSIVNSLKHRFINQYSPYLKQEGGTRWSDNLSEMHKANVSKEVVNSMDQWHNYIKAMQHQEVGEVFNYIDGVIEAVLPISANTARVSRNAQRLASNLIILGRPLYQVPQNLFQATYVSIKHPVHGPKAVAQGPFVLQAMLKADENPRMLAKILGVDETVAKDFVKTLETSGLWDSVGRADDFLQMSQNELTAGASNWFKFYTKKYGAGAIRAPFETSKHLQESSIKLVNLYAYLAEFNKHVVSGGKPFNAATKKLISSNVQRLTQTQNGINQFAYQNTGKVMSLAFQFMQHTHKLLLDVVLDPAVMSVTGKNIGKAASPFASSRTTALFTTGTIFSLFGFNGIFGENAGQYFSNRIREEAPDVATTPVVENFLDGGLINTFFNNAFLSGEKGKVDISGKINPASFVDSFYDFFLTSEGGVDLFGAAGTTVGSVLDAAKAALVLTTNPVMDTREKVFNIAMEVGELVKGFSDAERAYIAGVTGNWTYVSSLSGSLKVTEEEALYALFNVNPSMVSDHYNNRSSAGAKSKVPDSIKISKVFIKAMNRELASRKAEGYMSLAENIQIVQKYSEMAKAVVDKVAYPKVEQAFKKFGIGLGTPTYKEYIKPYINVESLEERMEGLQRLYQIAETPEAKEEIKAYIDIAERLIPQANEIYNQEK